MSDFTITPGQSSDGRRVTIGPHAYTVRGLTKGTKDAYDRLQRQVRDLTLDENGEPSKKHEHEHENEIMALRMEQIASRLKPASPGTPDAGTVLSQYYEADELEGEQIMELALYIAERQRELEAKASRPPAVAPSG